MTNPEDMAFPISGFDPGLTKREYFVARAMQGFLSTPDHSSDLMEYYERIAKKSLSMADELIKALNEQEKR